MGTQGTGRGRVGKALEAEQQDLLMTLNSGVRP